MRKLRLASSLLLLAALAVHADGAPEQAAMAHPRAAAGLDQQLKAHGAEVQHLERAVGEQELRSREASQRLQEQNRRIAELRHQLNDLVRSQRGAVSGS